MFKIEYYSEVYDDLDKLSDAVALEVYEYFERYETEPEKHSKRLHNQGGLNLEGCRKTYVANATYRIVIKIENNTAKVVEVVAVGKREDKEVYLEAHNRINNQ
ncbi:mRNA interferase RelE/StbE [Epsilonproteobacteria bacterium SCGC AD-311-C15]|jgi:mRNA interferase RelE/StbE|nr:mRNA interferase RelE/StbE [Epsilonproteobacteria bacterium SCGC AD-311-C15]